MKPEDITIDNYDYPLPDERIAKHPLAERDRCKLLVARDGELPQTKVFADLPELLPEGAVLVYNNTRVINARLRFIKSTGATIEIFCLEPAVPADYAQNFACTERCSWNCLVGNSKRWKSGLLETVIDIDGNRISLRAERLETSATSSVIEFSWDGGYSFARIIEAAGEIPIPPYLNRSTEESDTEDYQTVYSHIDGSVAAPTAGLHFTPEVLENIDRRGIKRLEVTLHVGAGTFRPVKSETIGEHDMHSEFIAVSREVISSLAEALATRRPIIAVGTTSVRTLESLYHIGCLIRKGKWQGEVPQWYPYSADHPEIEPEDALYAINDYLDRHGLSELIAATKIIIAPGYEYKVVKGMVTNFHQPRSTLLLLVSAFTGDPRWRELYNYALDNGYRFLSYGDACLLL
ncbi:MAG: S-adenosylmethionine:tRNA ribosyltransferase-isomerase [Muribaculaceae bacterium]|nr:S-adenosylmethionine:tRNA ribosyltransferase-isomerase [Muribaculaceae bacterium]